MSTSDAPITSVLPSASDQPAEPGFPGEPSRHGSLGTSGPVGRMVRGAAVLARERGAQALAGTRAEAQEWVRQVLRAPVTWTTRTALPRVTDGVARYVRDEVMPKMVDAMMPAIRERALPAIMDDVANGLRGPLGWMIEPSDHQHEHFGPEHFVREHFAHDRAGGAEQPGVSTTADFTAPTSPTSG